MLSQGFVLSRAENSENCYKGNDDQAGRAGPNPPAVTRAVHPLVVTLICKEKKGEISLGSYRSCQYYESEVLYNAKVT